VTGGDPPIADRLPEFAERIGIDLSPIDLTDPTDARWLLACVWPDTGRADRVEASIRLAQQHPPMLLTGRANQVLPSVLGDLPVGTTAIVMTTWAFGYFSIDERTEFVRILRTASERQPVVWISAENRGVVEALDGGPERESSDDILGALLIDGGHVEARPLARVHSHGNWIDWITEA
jgi:hypothetical protein